MLDKVLIVSESDDTPTNSICSWLNYYKVPYERLNDEVGNRSIKQIVIQNNNSKIVISHGNKLYNLLDYKLIWFRRGHLKFPFYFSKEDIKDSKMSEIILKQLVSEKTSVENFIEDSIKDKSINLPSKYNCDKLTAMRIAKDCGFIIPDSIFFNGTVFLNNKKRYFIKPNAINLNSYSEELLNIYSPHKVVKNKSEINSKLTLIQNYIDKKFELRVFYFCEYIYTVAIMSQSSKSTKHDSRNIENKNIRYIPFKLDKSIKERIKNFMQKLQIESGSIDMVYTNNNNYVFLEVNPAGQFDYIGGRTGKCIENDIAFKIKTIYEKV